MKASINGLNRYALQFAGKLCGTIEDMTGVHFKVKKSTLKEAAFCTGKNMVVFIPFAGTIQGNCIVALDEKVALRLIGSAEDPEQKPWEVRSEIADAVKEILNIALGQLMVQLEIDFGVLSYSSAIVAFGEVVFPKVASSSLLIEGDPGDIECGFSLDMVDLKIAKKLKMVTEDLEKKSKQVYIDSLTSLNNRRYFEETLKEEVLRSRESELDMSVLFIDIDFFKQINDSYGHHIGDLVLKAVSKVVKDTLRVEDIPCRYGGDEMVVILPETKLLEGKQAAERIKKAMTKLKIDECIQTEEHRDIKITLSIGVTQLKTDESIKEFLNRADSALYCAKENGRDQVVAK
ncbi:diguanylate cyclase [Chitinispirillales bacterium ANBcel5]|uniref:diguanylate cyclase n=1 Tax=Cellulosispirillum alkaliphilum TaxID=3039283 RepID=UPI002A589977|nr:diguanylate cyclase [Chitinispirillales bacterium ANBcel5]